MVLVEERSSEERVNGRLRTDSQLQIDAGMFYDSLEAA